jgi:hypothetical protein
MPLSPLNILPENAITIYRGQSKTLGVTIVTTDNKPVDITGGTIIMTVKESVDAAVPLIRKTSDVSTQVVVVSPREGKAQIFLVPADTQHLTIKQYIFDVWLLTADDKQYPVILPSVFDLKPGVTIIAA